MLIQADRRAPDRRAPKPSHRLALDNPALINNAEDFLEALKSIVSVERAKNLSLLDRNRLMAGLARRALDKFETTQTELGL